MDFTAKKNEYYFLASFNECNLYIFLGKFFQHTFGAIWHEKRGRKIDASMYYPYPA